jgi:Tol biopolymer transport system component
VGFNAGELVSVNMSGDRGRNPRQTLSDEEGIAVVELDLSEQENAALIHIIARGEESGLEVNASLSDYAIVTRKANGVSLLDEVRNSNAALEFGYVERELSQDFFVTWSTQGWDDPNHSAEACALFDTDGDSAIDIAVCGEVQTGNAVASGVFQAASSPSLFQCNNTREDRCGNPDVFGTPAQLRTYVRAGTLNGLEKNENLSGSRGGATATLRIVIDKTLLSHDARLVSVCSYNGGAETDPIDCIDSGTTAGSSADGTVTVAAVGPAIAGRIVYHSYASYNDGTSQLFVLNLSTGSLTNLSSGWKTLKDPMNAHWSPDGTRIVFMARPKKGGNYSAWYDVFLYTSGQAGEPVNLTKTASRHDEDPKFSPDGSRIVYRVRPSSLVEMDLGGVIRNTIISSSGPERSMPYYTSDASAVWFTHRPSGGSGSSTSIHRINVNGSNETVPADTAGVTDFYPIRDTIGQFLYSRTVSSTNLYGQIYLYNGSASVSLPFNTPDADYSDAFPVGTQYIVLSSTKLGGRGGYDLYIADRNTGALWPLSGYNSAVNTPREELGAAYTSN